MDENRQITDNSGTLLAVIMVVIILSALIFIIVRLWDKPGMPWSSGSAQESTEAADAEGGESGVFPVEEGLVRIASDQNLGDLDVAKNSSTYFLPINVYDRLVEIREREDGTPEILPSLAKEWIESPDGKLYTIYLRDDVVFSNGKPLTAYDVKFSLSRLLTVPGSEQTAYADMILGADELMTGKAEELKGIQVVDDHCLRVILNEPFPSFISMLSSPACSILCKEVVEAAGDSYGTDIGSIIGSGPYMLTEADDEMCVLEYNPKYWGKTPSVKKAEMRVMVNSLMNREFSKGNLDLLDLDFLNGEAKEQYLTDDDYTYRDRFVVKENVGIISLMLNTDIPPLNLVKIRKAVQYAIDRERIIKEVCGGYADITDGIFPKGLIGYTEENQGWLKYDPEKAKELVKEAGIGGNYTVELAIGSTADISIQRLTEIVQENLNAVGINTVTVVYDPDSRLYLRRNGKIMAYVFDWYADYNDPDNFIYTIFGSEEATKKFSSNYKDYGTMERIGKARTIINDEKRLMEYAALERKLIMDDAVWVPLYSSEHVFVKGDRVKSYIPYWAGWSDVILEDMELK